MAIEQQTVIRRTKDQKISAAAGAVAVQLAKQHNDPMYYKLRKYRQLMLKAREAIMDKYKEKALTIVRQRMTSGEIR